MKTTKTIDNKEFKIEQIEKTPFGILKDKVNKEKWLILGNEKLKKFESNNEIKWLDTIDWEVITATILSLIKYTTKNETK